MGALSAVGPAERTIPLLSWALSDADPDIREAAVHGLAQFGTNAEQAVLRVVRLLGDSNEMVRNEATNALKAIDPEAAAKTGVK